MYWFLAMGHSRLQCVEVEPGNPHLFWSASEDGTVRQFDTRMRCVYPPPPPSHPHTPTHAALLLPASAAPLLLLLL